MQKRHYIPAGGKVACGKNDHDLGGSSDTKFVNCRTCRSTLVFIAADTKAKEIEAQTIAKVKKTSERKRLYAKESWVTYIESLPGKNQYPRGF